MFYQCTSSVLTKKSKKWLKLIFPKNYCRISKFHRFGVRCRCLWGCIKILVSKNIFWSQKVTCQKGSISSDPPAASSTLCIRMRIIFERATFQNTSSFPLCVLPDYILQAVFLYVYYQITYYIMFGSNHARGWHLLNGCIGDPAI